MLKIAQSCTCVARLILTHTTSLLPSFCHIPRNNSKQKKKDIHANEAKIKKKAVGCFNFQFSFHFRLYTHSILLKKRQSEREKGQKLKRKLNCVHYLKI